MPYPSRACGRCKQARIKCDEVRPGCNRCKKKRMSCPGYESPIPLFTSFVDETIYASGAMRKPRKSRRGLPEDLSLAQQTSLPHVGCSDIDPNDQWVKIAVRGGVRSVPMGIRVSAETQAINFFGYHYLMSSPLSYDKAMWVYLNDYREQWELDEPETMLGLAMSSLVLALFNHMHPDSGVAVASYRRYNVAIKKIRQALVNTEQTVSDQLLLAVMAASYYEGAADDKQVPLPFDAGFRHQQGAVTLLCMRRRKDGKRNLALERSIRGQLVTHAMMLGTSLPEWLHDGVHYGLEDIVLELDSCLIQLIQLRDRCKGWRSRGSMLSEARIINQKAKMLEDRLVRWAAALPLDWMPKDNDGYYMPQETHRTLFLSNATITGTQIYTNFDHSINWNLYRAARLIILEISRTTTPAMNQLETDPGRLESARLINDICASVPYHFGRADLPFWEDGKRKVFTEIEGVRARAVGTLVVPMIIAVCRSPSSEITRSWLKEQLKVIGEIVGNKAIRQFLERV